MRALIRFLMQFKTLFFFLLMEIVSLAMIVNHSRFQRVHFLNSSNVVVGVLYGYADAVKDYFSLGEVNQRLSSENSVLKRQISELRSQLRAMRYDTTYVRRKDFSVEKDYIFRTARVVAATTNLSNNYLTIDKGRKDGIKEGMGVINDQGVVGIVNTVSSHFSVVLPIINSYARMNAKLTGKSEEGTLFWNGSNIHYAQLEEVPHYIEVNEGDIVRTSVYSSVFPEGMMVGKVVSWRSRKDNFYSIEVALSVDFGNLSYVDVIEFKNADEKKQLEESEVME
jgi:rod shape-determining protein MreC